MDIENKYTELYNKRETVRKYMTDIQNILHYYGYKYNVVVDYAQCIITTNPKDKPQPVKGLLEEYYDLLIDDFEYTKQIRKLAKQLWE